MVIGGLEKAVFWKKDDRYYDSVTHQLCVYGKKRKLYITYDFNIGRDRILYLENRFRIDNDGERLPEIINIIEEEDNVTYYFKLYEKDPDDHSGGYSGCDWCDMIYL